MFQLNLFTGLVDPSLKHDVVFSVVDNHNNTKLSIKRYNCENPLEARQLFEEDHHSNSVLTFSIIYVKEV